MDESLSDLFHLYTPAQYDQLLTAIGYLDEVGNFQCRDEIHSILMSGNDEDIGTAASRIYQTVEGQLFILLREHGIYANDSATLACGLYCTQAVLALPQYDDPESVLSLMEDDDNDGTDLLEEIFSTATGETFSEFHDMIDDVSPSFFEGLRHQKDAQAQQDGNLDEMDDLMEQPYVDRVDNLPERYREELTLLLADGVILGRPPEPMLVEQGDALTALERTPAAFAVRFLTTLCVSNLPTDQLLQWATDHLEQHIEDESRLPSLLTALQQEFGSMSL